MIGNLLDRPAAVTGSDESSVTDARDNRVDLLGVRFDAMLQVEVVDSVLGALENGEGGWISTPNSHHLRGCRNSAADRALIQDASYVVADGMPLVWASRMQGTPLPERVPGSDLVWSLARGAARDGRSIFLLGGDQGVAPRAQARLEAAIPGVVVVGHYCPPVGFEHDQQEQEHIARVLRETNPDIVYVGLGFPKQEQLITRLRRVMAQTWFIGVGISLSFIAEDQKRAPGWMQAAGLEWLHRLVREPRRLFGRYVRDGIPFVAGLLLGAGVVRVRRLLQGGPTRAPYQMAPVPVVRDISEYKRRRLHSSSSVELEVVIPVLNEERRIEPTLIALTSYLKSQPWRSRIIVVDNGCIDQTTTVADLLSSTEVPVVVIGCKSRGKGAAVRKGILSARAPLVGFCDADLSTPVEMIGPAVAMMEAGRPAVIGSRRCPGAHYAGEQSLGRRVGGAAFRRLARSVTQEVADTQCGFKFFHTEVARELFSRSEAEGFAFDVEIVGLAHAAGIEITELPVRWSDTEGSTFRPFVDGHGAVRELLALRARLRSLEFAPLDEALAVEAA